jgi:hypothetical protein
MNMMTNEAGNAHHHQVAQLAETTACQNADGGEDELQETTCYDLEVPT